MPKAVYACRTCAAKYDDWQDRCSVCGSWSSVDLDVREAQLGKEELGVVDRPVWGGYADDAQEVEVPADKRTP